MLHGGSHGKLQAVGGGGRHPNKAEAAEPGLGRPSPTWHTHHPQKCPAGHPGDQGLHPQGLRVRMGLKTQESSQAQTRPFWEGAQCHEVWNIAAMLGSELSTSPSPPGSLGRAPQVTCTPSDMLRTHVWPCRPAPACPMPAHTCVEPRAVMCRAAHQSTSHR